MVNFDDTTMKDFPGWSNYFGNYFAVAKHTSVDPAVRRVFA